jgi:hypothetical protein
MVGMSGEFLSGSKSGAESAVDIVPKPRRGFSLGFLPKVALGNDNQLAGRHLVVYGYPE